MLVTISAVWLVCDSGVLWIFRNSASRCWTTFCRYSSNRASVTRMNRYIYPRTYPTLLVFPDGSTVQIRYHEPRAIIKVISIHNFILSSSHNPILPAK